MVVDTAYAKQLGNDIIETANIIENLQDDVKSLENCQSYYTFFKNTNCISDNSIMDDVKDFYLKRVQKSISERERALSDLIGGNTQPVERKATAPSKKA